MGDYTGLKFKAKLSEMGDCVCFFLVQHNMSWDMVATHYPQFREFADHDRCEFIPRGGLQDMPKSWENKNKYDKSQWTWEVCCALKNYSRTIEKFLESVLPWLISEPCEVIVYSNKTGDFYHEIIHPRGWE